MVLIFMLCLGYCLPVVEQQGVQDTIYALILSLKECTAIVKTKLVVMVFILIICLGYCLTEVSQLGLQ